MFYKSCQQFFEGFIILFKVGDFGDYRLFVACKVQISLVVNKDFK